MGRLLLALAVAFPLMVVLASVADGATGYTGPATLNCMHWKDGMRISPGVGNVPANQSVAAHGRLYGCDKLGGGAQFHATLFMANATCANLEMSGSASFDWGDGSHSTAYLRFDPQEPEPNKVHVTGTMTSGVYQGLVVNGWVRFTQVYTGTGANCSPTNLLRKIEFSNTQSFMLLTPIVATTTQPPQTTHPTTPNTPPPTVPITNFGGPTTAPTFPPVTVVVFQGPLPSNGGVAQPFPQGTLAFTGSSSGTAAMFGFEALLIGGALALLDPERRRRRMANFAYAHRPKRFLQVTLPPMR